jgi:hypothetical protein
MLVAVFSASAALANAQAVARGSGGGGSSSSSSGGGSSSSGGSSSGGGSTSSSSGGGSTYSGGGGRTTYSAPSHSSAPARTPSHTSGSTYSGGSSYRGGSASGNYGTAPVRRPDGGSTTLATAPTYSRPSGSNIVGYAVPRVPSSRQPSYYYPPIYLNPWFFGFGYGYGLNYFYDPFYGPFSYSGFPGGYPGYGYGYYGFPDPYGYDTWDTYSQSRVEPSTGKLRLKVKQRDAKVMVDGAFVGTVEDFNGLFNKLTLPEGRHLIVLQLDGYESLSFEVMIIGGETVNYKGEMQKLSH